MLPQLLRLPRFRYVLKAGKELTFASLVDVDQRVVVEVLGKKEPESALELLDAKAIDVD